MCGNLFAPCYKTPPCISNLPPGSHSLTYLLSGSLHKKFADPDLNNVQEINSAGT